MSTAMEKVARLETSLKNIKAKGREVARQGTSSVMTVAGGVAAGVLAAKLPLIPNTNLPSDAVVGTALVGLGLAGMAGEFDDQVIATGSGMLAVAAARETQKAMAK